MKLDFKVQKIYNVLHSWFDLGTTHLKDSLGLQSNTAMATLGREKRERVPRVWRLFSKPVSAVRK